MSQTPKTEDPAVEEPTAEVDAVETFEGVAPSNVREGDRLQFMTRETGFNGRGLVVRTGTVAKVTAKTVRVDCGDNYDGTAVLRKDTVEWHSRDVRRIVAEQPARRRDNAETVKITDGAPFQPGERVVHADGRRFDFVSVNPEDSARILVERPTGGRVVSWLLTECRAETENEIATRHGETNKLHRDLCGADLETAADREHCVSVRGGKVHEVTEWDDQGPDYVFPLCRTGSMTNSGTKYRKTTEALSCTNCVANRERRRARQAEEATAAETPAVEAAAPDPAPAVEEPVRYLAEFGIVKADPGHTEMRLSIRVRGEQGPVVFYALPYVPGWTAEGVCRAFGWRPVADELEFIAMDASRGEVAPTVSSATPGAVAARTALREEIVARLTVRLTTGAAAHFRPVFRLGSAYPIGWTYRLGYGTSALFGWVAAGGALPERLGVHTREDAEAELRAHDPAGLPANPALHEHVSGRSVSQLGRLFLAARNADPSALPDDLKAGAPITASQAREVAERKHGVVEEFETLQGRGGRFLGWTFRSGRLHSARYGWVTATGTVGNALEPYRSTAGDVLVYADRDEREAAARKTAARSMTGRKLAENRCVHSRYARTDVQGDPVAECLAQSAGDSYAVFDGESVTRFTSCAVSAANQAARMGGWDQRDGADPQPFWAKTCPQHDGEVSGRCTLCGQDTPDEDAGEDVQGDPLPDHGPAAHPGRRVVCSYADHTAPAREDGTADEHERTPGVIDPCPGSLLPAREHSGQPTRQDTIALSFNGPRGAWLVTGARAGDVVRYDMEELTVEDVQVDEDDLGTVYLHLGRVSGPVRFTVGERLIFARRVRKQDARCRVCNVYAVIESDTAAHGTIQSRVCGVCVEQGARSAALAAHSDAHAFTPFTRHGEDHTAGWTFRTGHGAGARYGVVTAACQVAGVGLYEYRTTAERAYLYGEDQEADRS
ncbi:hypothetical protein ACKI16_29570 [Streptomyces scabiei]|uniref:hypothetical protein n=1 Tax=Streptomyces scabiei TaxID=1930 RepID=UPI0038F71F12